MCSSLFGKAAGRVLLLLLIGGSVLRSQRALKDGDILRVLNQVVTWHKNAVAMAQGPVDSREAMFADGLRHSSTDAARAVFDFARAQAAIPAGNPQDVEPADVTRTRTLAQSAATAEQRIEEAQHELEQINGQLQAASGAARERLIARRDEVTSEANFAKARRDALRTLLGFLSAPDEGGLPAKINNLERTAPDVAAARQKAVNDAGAAIRPSAPDFQPESSGIAGLTATVFSMSQKLRQLDRLAGETEAVRQAVEQLRGPLRTALREVIRAGDSAAQAPEAADVAALKAQKKDLDTLLARFRQLSASSAPLSDASAQIAASRTRIAQWRAELAEVHGRAIRQLLLRIAMLAATLLLIVGLSELWRRGTMRYVQELRRRRQFLLLRRIVVGCAVTVVVVLSFVTEFGSLATVAGFSAAGIAVAMQSVILSVIAYFFLVGRWGVRVGDRVTVGGVTGEVADVGLFRLYLMELGGVGSVHPTGRMVVFPNAVFFQPAALFKQLPGMDYAWRTMTVRLAGTTEYEAVERRILDAVEKIYEEYREVVARQHSAAQASLNLHTKAPQPESRVRFISSGLEITIRYPVELRRAAEIDDRITREVIRQVEEDPKLTLTGGDSLQLEATAG